MRGKPVQIAQGSQQKMLKNEAIQQKDEKEVRNRRKNKNRIFLDACQRFAQQST